MVKEKIAENIILLSFDYKFKKMFGDNDAIDRLEVIISIIFDLPVEDIKGKISILNGEKLVESENEEKGRMDVYLRLQLKVGYERIDIQVSDRKLSQSIIDRNLLYGAHKLVKQLQRNEDYAKLEPVIVISFSSGKIKEDDDTIFEKYLLRNSRNKILTTKLQYYDVNIVNCYEIWYSNKEDAYDEKMQQIIKLGALLHT